MPTDRPRTDAAAFDGATPTGTAAATSPSHEAPLANEFKAEDGEPAPTRELIALRELSTAVRGRDVATGSPLTWRRKAAGIVPGQRLRVQATSEWTFRKTRMIGGPLLAFGFSLRALRQAGFSLPCFEDGRLRSPAEADSRLRRGLRELANDHLLQAHGDFVLVLSEQPGCLVAHAAMAEVLEALSRPLATAHRTAAIRLGHAAVAGAARPALDPTGPVERALLSALVERGRRHARLARPDLAAADLRRALAWDPGDALGAGQTLALLDAAASPTSSSPPAVVSADSDRRAPFLPGGG